MDEIVLQQALFGYEDGHRLLQSSFHLSNYEKDLLLQLSDLAPGISRLREEGYWTGMPLRETSQYALLRTWPAPEKSRPGCVWTHAILIPFQYLQSELDLLWLSLLFRRPEHQGRFKEYGMPINAKNAAALTVGGIPNTSELVSCIYFSHCESTSLNSQEELGLQAIAVWAQQWTALREAFSFRTVEKPSAGRSWLSNFDMMLTGGTLRLQGENSKQLRDFGEDADTQEVLAADLVGIDPFTSRKFREKYALDFPLHPYWTAFLAAVQTRVRTLREKPKGSLYQVLLREVAQALPEQSLGTRLKRDLTNFGPSSPLCLPSELAASALKFFASAEEADSYPSPTFTKDVLRMLWAQNRPQLFESLRILHDRDPELWRNIIAALSETVPDEELMEVTESIPEARRELILLRPSLLRWKGLTMLPAEEVVSLLGLLRPDQIREHEIVRHLIYTNNPRLATFLCEQFPEEVVFAVCAGGSYVTHHDQPNESILRYVGDVAYRYIGPDFVSRLTTTTALLSFAAMLGFVSEVTVSAGPQIWGQALTSAVQDSSLSDLQTLQAFAFSLAAATQKEGAELLFMFSFEPLHDAMRESRLDYQASVIVGPHLPDVGWWHRWDNCYRLRIATIRSYAYGNLSPKSFRHLARSQSLMGELFHELESKDEFYNLRERIIRSIADK